MENVFDNKLPDNYMDILNDCFLDEEELFKSSIKYILLQDECTKIHSLNVSKYALLLGKELNLDEKDLKFIKIGGILHDIGKIKIPMEILNKPQRLTKEEYEIIKKHPIFGIELLSTDGYKEIRDIILSHHERIDGNGYLDGLKANDIPLLVRIISIADAFDAMTTHRPYNKEKTIEEALTELERCSGHQFDSDLVEVFARAIKKEKTKIKVKKKENK